MKAPRPDENPCKPRHFKPPPCAPVALDEPTRQVLETGRSRLLVTAALFAVAFGAIGVRLVDVTLIKPPSSEARAAQAARAVAAAKAEVRRGDIVDRNGQLIATTLVTPSLYANPKQIQDAAAATKQLVAVLPDLDAAEVKAKLSSEKSFVWLKRHLTPKQQFEVNRLGIPALQFEREERRIYPDGNLAAHVVGFSDVDAKGLAGIERGLDDKLHAGSQVKLALDIRVQHILHDELTKAKEEFSALGATGLVMDVRTGEIVSMVSLPDFDPNQPKTQTEEGIFNRATLGAYEMGSTFKIFNTAMAIDNHVSTLASSYDATHSIRVGRFTIEDYHAKRRWLSVAEIFMYSSNIGSVKMALDAGTDRQKEFFSRLGMLKAPTLEIPELAAPLVPAPWREVNTMTIAFGHGMSVTPLQMAIGVSAMVNGGIMRPATMLKREPADVPEGRRVIAQKTSEDIRRLMRLVVEQGTGSMAAAPGYIVGGKTGTAEKVAHKGYARKSLLSSFIGAFPINDPKYLVLVMIDEPHGTKKTFGYATGGWVAAPAVSRIVTRAAPILGVPPVDENTPEIRRALLIDQPGLQVKKVASN